MLNISDPAALRALTAERGFLEKFFSIMPVAVMIYDAPAQRITYFNDRLKALLGYTPAEIEAMGGNLLGVTAYASVDAQGLQAATKLDTLDDNFVFNADWSFQHKEGSMRHVKLKLCMLKRDPAGQPLEFLCFCEDDTEARESAIAANRVRQLLETSEKNFKYGSWVWNYKTGIVTWSDGMFELFQVDKNGYAGNLLPIQVYLDHMPPEEQSRIGSISERAFEQKLPAYALEHWIVDRTGAKRFIAVRAKCEYDAEGELTTVFGTCFDLTEVKQTRDDLERVNQDLYEKIDQLNQVNRQLERNQEMLEEAEILTGFGSYEWNMKSGKLNWSEGMYHILGYDDPQSRAEITVNYDLWMRHVHEEDREKMKNNITARLEDKGAFEDLEHRVYDRHGQLHYLVTQGKVLVDEQGEADKLIGSTVDVTQLHRYQRELEDMVDALRRSNKDLEEFAYIASHDLREPLRKVIAFGDRLVMRFSSVLSEEGDMYVQRMQEAARRMERLLDDLLSFSRVTRMNDPFIRVSLDDVLQTVLKDLEIAIDQSNAKVQVIGELPEMEVVESQIRQYLQNIISNALKFAKPDEAPRIVVEVEKVMGQDVGRPNFKPGVAYCKLVIRDNGIGFEPEDAERIFTLFQRLHGRSEFEGSGIGLAICKKIAENHQGGVYAESVPGQGSVFTLLLPFSQN